MYIEQKIVAKEVERSQFQIYKARVKQTKKNLG